MTDKKDAERSGADSDGHTDSALANARATGNAEKEREDRQSQAEEGDESLAARVKQFAAELKLNDWLMVALTAIIALASGWNTFYVGGQLAEMRSGAVDTHNLVVATQNLVVAYTAQEREIARLRSATENFAKAMRDEADNTGRLVAQAQQSAGYSKESAEAAEGQLIEMQAVQRAQIGLTGWRATQPLSFKDGRAILQVQFDLRNSGHTLAEYVDAHAVFYFPVDRFVVRKQEETCRKPSPRIGDSPTGFSVAADGTFSFPFYAAMTADDVTRWGKAYSPTVQKGVPYLVGCILYFSDGKPHHTPFVFEIDKKANTPGGFDHIDPTKGDIPADQVMFLIPPWYAGKTD